MSVPGLHPFTAVYQVRFGRPVAAAENCRLLAELLERIAHSCVAAGAQIIGHIKTFAAQPGGGYLAGSVTSTSTPAQVEASNLQVADRLELSLTVLVYGLEVESLAQIVAEAWLALADEGLLLSAHQQPVSRFDPAHEEQS